MKTTFLPAARAGLLVLVTLGPGLPAARADQAAAAGTGIPEVVVTARRREESLQEVPVSVAAFRTEDLENATVRNITDLASVAPNLVAPSGPTGHNDGFYFIRGIGQVDLNAASDPGVGTYVDGVYLGRIIGANPDAMNLDRVEVLRGPQGTLFGRNTIGGAINIVTHSPTGQLGGNLKVTAGSDSRVNAMGNLDFPVTDSLAGTVSAYTQNKDGRATNVTTGKTIGDIETYGARTKFVWKATEDFSAEFAADYAKENGTTIQSVLVNFNPQAVSPLGVPLPQDLGSDRSSDPDVNFYSIDPKYDTETWGVNLTLNGRLGPVNVKSITAYRKLAEFAANDFDTARYTFYDNFFKTNAGQVSEEFQLSGEAIQKRLNWLVGFSYYSESAGHTNAIAMGGNNGCLPFPAAPPPGGYPYPVCDFAGGQQYATRNVDSKIVNNQHLNVDTDAKALFTHMTFDFTQRLRGTAGIRWTDEEKTQKYDFYIDNAAGVANLAGLPPAAYLPTLSPNNPFLTVPTTYDDSWSVVTPTVGLDFRWTDQLMLYASWSEGFRSGGFNGRPTPNQQGQFGAVQPYKPEKTDAFEVGVKSEWFDRRLRANLAGFFTKYRDIQLLVLGSSGFFETKNAAEAELKGFELEVTGRPLDGAELFVNTGYLSAKYTQLDPGTVASGILMGNPLPNAPRWTLNVGGSYELGLPGGSSLYGRADWTWKDDTYFNATALPGEFQPAYGLWNARFAWRSPARTYEVAAYGLNLADKVYYTNGQDVTQVLGVAFENVGPRREFGVEGTYRF